MHSHSQRGTDWKAKEKIMRNWQKSSQSLDRGQNPCHIFPLVYWVSSQKSEFLPLDKKKSKMSQKLKTENPFWSLLRNKHACAGKSQKFRVHLWSIVFISVSCFDLCVGGASDRDSDLISSRASLTEGSWRREQDTYRVICSGTYLHERGWGGTAAGSGRHRPGPNVGLSYLRAES